MKTLFLWGGVGVAIAAGIFLVLSFASAPGGEEQNLGPDYSRAMPYEGAQHFPEGTQLNHESNPPTSGSHWPDPLLDGVYDTEKPEEAIIHSLEHGRVWISYRPDIPQEAIDQLTQIASREVRVILTPRSANETAIALAAWTRLDTFDLTQYRNSEGQLALSEVEGRVRSFIARYRDKGPEYVPQMTGKRYE